MVNEWAFAGEAGKKLCSFGCTLVTPQSQFSGGPALCITEIKVVLLPNAEEFD